MNERPQEHVNKPGPRSLRGVVVIVADQLHAGHLGHAGNEEVRTPHLDRLAARSRRFTNAFVANPTCMPNRAAIMTGRMPSVIGSRTNGIALDPGAENFVSQLRNAGWRTGAAGKLHFQNMGWPLEGHEYDDMLSVSPILVDPTARDARPIDPAPGWDQYELSRMHRERWVDMPVPYYGFDDVDLVVGHGDSPSGHYCHWAAGLAAETGLNLGDLAGYDNAEVRLDSWNEVWKTRVPAELHPTSYTKHHVIDQLRRAAVDDAPFFVFGSFPDPHHPFCPPSPYWEQYSPADLSLPSTFGAQHIAPPPHIESLFANRGVPGYATALWAPDEHQMRAVLAAQYGQVTFIDDAVGEILDEIDRLGLTDEVLVVFTTDHGDMMGEHGLLLKQTAQYPAVTRVPLLLSGPSIVPGIDDRLVQSIDLAPTIMEMAGVAPYRGIQGSNIAVVDEADQEERDALLIEEEYPFGVAGLPAPINIRSVITRHARMTVYPGHAVGELYDHREDPDELVNRFDDPSHAHLRAEMFEALSSLLIEHAERGRAPTDAA